MLPDRWSVAGVSCTALSVWHVFALHSEGNPYVAGGSCDRDAAAGLLLFASLNHADGKRLFSAPLFRARQMRHIMRKLKRAEWSDIDAAVNDYLSACSRVPGHKQVVSKGAKGSQSRQCAAPICWALVDFLSAGNPDKIESAWNTPYTVAKCLFDARRDVSGEDDTLETLEEEIRFDAYQAKEQA